MANNIIDISLLNPIRFVNLGGVFKGFDNDWFTNLTPDFQDQVNYFQKWQTDDIIKLQFRSNFTPINIAVIDCSGVTISTHAATKKVTNLVDDALDTYETSIPLAGLEGVYYLLLTAGTSTNQSQLISEPLYIAETIEHSILLTYFNTENVQDVIFDTGIEFTFRVEGFVTALTPGFKDTLYQDQVLDNVLLNSIPFRQFKFMIGGEYGVPDWIIDKVNRILSCDTWDADGSEFVKKDGTQWTAVTLDNYPMSGWSIDVLEAKTLSSKRATNTGDPTQEIAIVYNIETKLFGTFNDLPDNNIAQITEID